MAQTGAQRRAAQRRLARELGDIRAGRAQWRKSEAGRSYERALKKMNAPVLVKEHARGIFHGSELHPNWRVIDFNIDRMTDNQRTLSMTMDLGTWQQYGAINSPGNVWFYHSAGQAYFDEWRGESWNVNG